LTGLFVPLLKPPVHWLLAEGHPVELLTFGFLMAGSFISIRTAIIAYRRALPLIIPLFFSIFGLLLLIVGMEEVAWGQNFISFETPSFFKLNNEQNETTLHNIKGIHGRTEWLRLIFGIGGIFGIFVAHFKKIQILTVPPILIPWFLTITAHAFFDVLEDYINTPEQITYAMSRSAELVEGMIAFAAFLYVWIKLKTITAHPAPESAP